MRDFFADWFHDSDWRKSKKKKSDHSVYNDRWDREDISRLFGDMPQFSNARTKLGDFTPTGKEAIADAFWSLYKSSPDLIEEGDMSPEYLINRRVIEEMLGMDEAERLRRYSVNDEIQAALGVVGLEPDLETLFDRVEQERHAAEQLKDLLDQLAKARQDKTDIDEMVERWKQDNNPKQDQPQDGQQKPQDGQQGDQQGQQGQQGDQGQQQPQEGQEGQEGEGQGDQPGQGAQSEGASGKDLDEMAERWGDQGDGEGEPEVPEDMQKQQSDAADKVDDLEEQVAEAMVEMEKSLDRVGSETRIQMRNPLNNAAKEAADLADTAAAWGVEPGELRRMDAQERLKLAKKLNTPYFRKIADIFGPMKNMMWAEQKRRVEWAKEEIHDVTIGSDIGRLLPQEMLNLSNPVTKQDFFRRHAEGKLLQYEMRGEIPLSRGGIIFCEDGSGSMEGEKELWAKGVMLCLLHLARKQKRPFHLIHFGSPGQVQVISFENPSDYSFDKIVEAAELFFNGGTDFHTPMNEALEILRSQFSKLGHVKSDIVFCTDDQCYVDAKFMHEFLAESERLQFTTYGIAITHHAPEADGALATMSEGKVVQVKDLLSGEDVREIFRQL